VKIDDYRLARVGVKSILEHGILFGNNRVKRMRRGRKPETRYTNADPFVCYWHKQQERTNSRRRAKCFLIIIISEY